MLERIGPAHTIILTIIKKNENDHEVHYFIECLDCKNLTEISKEQFEALKSGRHLETCSSKHEEILNVASR